MVNFRQVTISNADNTKRIDLNDFNGLLMTSPTGLGVYRQSEYITIGNQRISTNNKPKFQKITFNITILGARSSWESKYENLRDFISQNLHEGFRLYYTANEETRYIMCDINMVDKTEKDGGHLPVKIEVQPLSLWLQDVQKTTISEAVESNNPFRFVERDIDEETIYSAQFNEVAGETDEYDRAYYGIEFGATASNKAVINNRGEEVTPLKIRVYGRVINPRINLKRVGTGEIVQFVSFANLTVNSGYYLEINANPTNTYVEQVNTNTGERFDVEDLADIDSNIYLKLPKGDWEIQILNEDLTSLCYTEIFYANQFYGG